MTSSIFITNDKRAREIASEYGIKGSFFEDKVRQNPK